MLKVLSDLHEIRDNFQKLRHIVSRDSPHGLPQNLRLDQSKQRRHVLIAHGGAAEGDDLIESGHGIPHAASAGEDNLLERHGTDLDALCFRYFAQTFHDQRILDKLETVLLAPGEDRRGNLVIFRCREYENDVCGRLFESFQKRIKGFRA